MLVWEHYWTVCYLFLTFSIPVGLIFFPLFSINFLCFINCLFIEVHTIVWHSVAGQTAVFKKCYTIDLNYRLQENWSLFVSKIHLFISNDALMCFFFLIFLLFVNLILQLHNPCSCYKAFYIWHWRNWKICWILLSGFVMPAYWKYSTSYPL